MKSNNNIKKETGQSEKDEKLFTTSMSYVETIVEPIVDTIPVPFLITDKNFRVIAVNPAFCDFFQVSPKETVGSIIYDLGNRQWNIPALKDLLEKILPEKTSFKGFEVEHDFPKIGHKVILINARRIYKEKEEKGTFEMGLLPMILIALEDITPREEYLEELEALVAKRTKELKARVDELEQFNKAMVGRELKMIELKKEIEELKKS